MKILGRFLLAMLVLVVLFLVLTSNDRPSPIRKVVAARPFNEQQEMIISSRFRVDPAWTSRYLAEARLADGSRAQQVYLDMSSCQSGLSEIPQVGEKVTVNSNWMPGEPPSLVLSFIVPSCR
jgi:hypothetical protein